MDKSVIEQGVAHLAQTVLGIDESSRVFGLERIFTGMEADIYAFSVESGGDATRKIDEYVLKLFAGDSSGKAEDEYATMQAVVEVGLRCPGPVAFGEASSALKTPFILMERIRGPSLKQAFYRASEQDKSEALATLCEIFVEIHRADWEPFRETFLGWDAEDPHGYLLALMPGILEEIKKLRKPGFVPVWNWLGERMKDVPCEHPAIIHGDFHPGNVLMPPGARPVVLDWGGATIGDARKDLAWTLLLMGGDDPTVRGLVYQEYLRQWGSPLDGFEYFEVLACLTRLLFIVDSYGYLIERLRQREDSDQEIAKLAAHVYGTHQLMYDRTGIDVTEVHETLDAFPMAA